MKYILFWLPGCANPSFYLTLLSGNNAVTTVGKPTKVFSRPFPESIMAQLVKRIFQKLIC